MAGLHQIQAGVRLRTEEITALYPHWPCHKGCDDCCRRLASVPQVSQAEWELIDAALHALPSEIAEQARCRIRESKRDSRPVICPLLDTRSGACLVYDARPVACRAYGFYAERRTVLGCARIETIAGQFPDVVWGNHETLDHRLNALGEAAPVWEWLASATTD